MNDWENAPTMGWLKNCTDEQRLKEINSFCEMALSLARSVGPWSVNSAQPPTLLQIGANDGVQDDLVSSFIKKSKIRSILLEPVPSLYEELVKNYASYENVECYNCGIASYTGKKNITTVDYENFCKDWESKEWGSPPIWANGLSTYDETKNCLGGPFGVEATNKEIRAFKTEVETDVFTLPDFLNTHGIDRIDIYESDAEGYDCLIFDQLDLKEYSPFLILAETHSHKLKEIRNMRAKLLRHKYSLLTEERAWDTIAVKRV
tara:strand:+ start:1746 stop:2531 length:786 start_codon:yes stop_codon:yes gene_type:complete